MSERVFYYHVGLKCEYGPDLGGTLSGCCAVRAKNGTDARRQIIAFVAEQNKPNFCPDGKELSFEERQHVSDNWSRWRVDFIDVLPEQPFELPEDKPIFWDNWTRVGPGPEEENSTEE
jgi:hypothetical protein